jgi:pSer/pThr/pTyr-binding forkhead associated (FHA) protein
LRLYPSPRNVETLLFALRVLIVVALYAFLGVVLWVLLRERSQLAAPQPAAQLITLGADGADGKSIELIAQSPTWLGRDPNCAARVNTEFASSRHAWIEWRSAKQVWWLEDNASRNGTLVNGERVMRCELRPGDVVDIGGARFRFEVEHRTQITEPR